MIGSGRQGDRRRRAADVRQRVHGAPTCRRGASPRARRAGADRGRHRQAARAKTGRRQGRRPGQRHRRRPARSDSPSSASPRFAGNDTPGGATWALFDLPTAQAFVIGKPGFVDADRRRRRRLASRAGARRPHRADAASRHQNIEVLTGRQITDENKSDIETRPQLPHAVPVDLRPHRHLRRQLHHLQRVQHLRGAAPAGERAAAGDRREPRAGHQVAARRGARRRHRGFAARLRRRHRPGQADPDDPVERRHRRRLERRSRSSRRVRHHDARRRDRHAAVRDRRRRIRSARIPPLAAMRDVSVDRAGVSRKRIVLGVLFLADRRARHRHRAERHDRDARRRRGRAVHRADRPRPARRRRRSPRLATPIARAASAASWARSPGATRRATPSASPSPPARSGVGLALLVGVATLGSSATQSIRDQVGEQFLGDFTVTPSDGGGGGFGGLPSGLAQQISALPDVKAAAGIGGTGVNLLAPGDDKPNGTHRRRRSTPPRPPTRSASASPPAAGRDLGADGILVSKQHADDAGIGIDDQIGVTLLDGTNKQLTVQGIFDSNIFGDYVMDRSTFDGSSNPLFDQLVVIAAKPGADPTARDQGRRRPVPDGEVPDPRRVHRQPDRTGRRVPQLHLRAARHVDLHRHPRHRHHAAAVGLRAPTRARADARRRHDTWPGGRQHVCGSRCSPH